MENVKNKTKKNIKYHISLGDTVIHRGITSKAGKKELDFLQKWRNGYMEPQSIKNIIEKLEI